MSATTVRGETEKKSSVVLLATGGCAGFVAVLNTASDTSV